MLSTECNNQIADFYAYETMRTKISYEYRWRYLTDETGLLPLSFS